MSNKIFSDLKLETCGPDAKLTNDIRYEAVVYATFCTRMDDYTKWRLWFESQYQHKIVRFYQMSCVSELTYLVKIKFSKFEDAVEFMLVWG